MENKKPPPNWGNTSIEQSGWSESKSKPTAWGKNKKLPNNFGDGKKQTITNEAIKSEKDDKQSDLENVKNKQFSHEEYIEQPSVASQNNVKDDFDTSTNEDLSGSLFPDKEPPRVGQAPNIEEIPTPSNIKNCLKCGKTTGIETKFCTSCGSPFDQPMDMQQNIQDIITDVQKPVAVRESKITTMAVVIAILATIIVSSGVFLFIYFGGNDAENNTSVESEPIISEATPEPEQTLEHVSEPTPEPSPEPNQDITPEQIPNLQLFESALQEFNTDARYKTYAYLSNLSGIEGEAVLAYKTLTIGDGNWHEGIYRIFYMHNEILKLHDFTSSYGYWDDMGFGVMFFSSNNYLVTHATYWAGFSFTVHLFESGELSPLSVNLTYYCESRCFPGGDSCSECQFSLNFNTTTETKFIEYLVQYGLDRIDPWNITPRPDDTERILAMIVDEPNADGENEEHINFEDILTFNSSSSEVLYNAINNTFDMLYFNIYWFDGTVTHFYRDNLGDWYMTSRFGGTEYTTPIFTLRGTTLEVSFPNVRRVYYLYEDMYGIFGDEELEWGFGMH